MSYQIKHMGLGGILDQAIAIIRDHFVLLFTIVLFLLFPLLLAQNYLNTATAMKLPPNPTWQDIVRANQERSPYATVSGLVLMVYSLIAVPLANAAVIQAVARLYLGQPITALAAIQHGFRKLAPLIGTNILMGLTIGVGFLLCIIPGIYFAIWYGLSQHVVVIEDLAAVNAMKRSKQLVHKDRGKFLALMIIVSVISFAVYFGAKLIPQPYVSIFVSSLLQTLTTVFWTAVGVVFYFSCRCGVENFDLHYLAESIGEEPAEAGGATD